MGPVFIKNTWFVTVYHYMKICFIYENIKENYSPYSLLSFIKNSAEKSSLGMTSILNNMQK